MLVRGVRGRYREGNFGCEHENQRAAEKEGYSASDVWRMGPLTTGALDLTSWADGPTITRKRSMR